MANGMTKTHVAVTAELLSPSHDDENEATCSPADNFLICFRTEIVDDHPEQKGICDDACQSYQTFVQQLDFSREEFMEEWRRMLSYNIPFKVTGRV
jgi:hypothetical protein